VFGVYALAVLVALLTLGTVSDHLGRRPVLLAAIGGQAVALIVFATASGVTELLLARVVQGLATGAALGALGAGMIDISRDRGTLANAVAPGIGTGFGALLSGVVVQYLPAPQHLIYLVLLTVLGAQAVGVLLLQETVSRKPGALGALVPDVKLPRATRGPVLVAAPVLIAVWSLAGFYASLGPALIRRLTGSPSVVLGALGLFLLAGVAASATYLLRDAAPRLVMLAGVVALLVGVGLTLAAISAGSALLFFTATATAGFGFGAGFQGGIRTVVPLAAASERSGVLSLLFVISYLGLGAPAVAAGYLVVHDGGLIHTATEYGIFVMALAVLACTGLVRRPAAARISDSA
jgi:predicted MFS family arabinose efflux permease